jgi:hypothetical protein
MFKKPLTTGDQPNIPDDLLSIVEKEEITNEVNHHPKEQFEYVK